jgi:hypothetical protein
MLPEAENGIITYLEATAFEFVVMICPNPPL